MKYFLCMSEQFLALLLGKSIITVVVLVPHKVINRDGMGRVNAWWLFLLKRWGLPPANMSLDSPEINDH